MLSKSALIFNIVHGSFVDGWGIRTTVFLKGCPLRCRWCCNPEGQEKRPELQVIPEHCSRCGKCLSRCPEGALSLTELGIRVDRKKCTGCGKCTSCCWPGALELWGRSRTAEDVFAECLEDKVFYQESGGGITLSGGEPTQWPGFCLEILRLCHNVGIRVAIDTCGQVLTSDGLEVLRQADLILYDIKGLDPARHRENTGVSNEIILKNLSLLETWGKEVIIRYPVIPGHNLDEAENIASFLAQFRCIRRVDLIPYHNYGSEKYAQLGRTYTLGDDKISPEEQQDLLQIFRSSGLNVQIGG